MDFAVKQVVDTCLQVKKGAKSVIITDNDTKHIAQAVADKINAVGGIVQLFVMEDFGQRPEDGSQPLEFPEKIGKALKEADVSIYAAQAKKGEFKSFRKPMFACITENPGLCHAHMIGIQNKIMEMGMAADYNIIKEITAKVKEHVYKSRQIKVTSARGTNFTTTFNPAWKWEALDGFIRPGHWSNLPEGEVFTCPKSVDGKVVVDGVIGDYLAHKYGIIEQTPLNLEIANGYVTSVSCKKKELEQEIREYIKKGPNANRIGEFAIGTNVALKSLIGNLLQDEKFPGVHIAVGDSLSEHTGADWTADVHMDMVIQKVNIEVDGKTIMKEGKFLIA